MTEDRLCGCGYRNSLHHVADGAAIYCELAKARFLASSRPAAVSPNCPNCIAAIAYLKQEGPWPNAQLDTHSEVERLAQLLRMEVLVKGTFIDLGGAAAAVSSQPEEQTAIEPTSDQLGRIFDDMKAQAVCREQWDALSADDHFTLFAIAVDSRASQPEGWQPIAERIRALPRYTEAEVVKYSSTYEWVNVGELEAALPPAPTGAPGAQKDE